MQAYDSTLLRFGYRIDTEDCFAVLWQPDDADWLSRLANWLAREPASHAAVLSLGSCALRPGEREPAQAAAERRVSALFDRIEKACAKLFQGQTALTDALGAEWSREYPALDARLQTYGDRAVFERYLLLQYVDLGPLTAWEEGRAALPGICAPTMSTVGSFHSKLNPKTAAACLVSTSAL